jgi:hypothetical protein
MSASGGSGGSGQNNGGTAQGGSGGAGPETGGSTSTPRDVPTPAAVGLSISLSPPEELPTVDIGGRTCPAGASGAATYTLGKPAPGGTIADGTDGVTVDCTVRADGSVSASVSGYDSERRERISLSFAGALGPSSVTGPTAVFQFYAPETLALHTGSPFPNCSVGPITTLKAGAVLADFSCPIIVASDDSTSGCAVHGTLAFEYCQTGEEEP